MTPPLPRIKQNKPTRKSFAQRASLPPCEAAICPLMMTVLRKCPHGASYTVNGYQLCPSHAGRVALDALVAHFAEGATSEIEKTAAGLETAGSCIGKDADEKEI